MQKISESDLKTILTFLQAERGEAVMEQIERFSNAPAFFSGVPGFLENSKGHGVAMVFGYLGILYYAQLCGVDVA